MACPRYLSCGFCVMYRSSSFPLQLISKLMDAVLMNCGARSRVNSWIPERTFVLSLLKFRAASIRREPNRHKYFTLHSPKLINIYYDTCVLHSAETHNIVYSLLHLGSTCRLVSRAGWSSLTDKLQIRCNNGTRWRLGHETIVVSFTVFSRHSPGTLGYWAGFQFFGRGRRPQWLPLRPLKHWDHGFEYHLRHGCLYAFILWWLCCCVCRQRPCDVLISRTRNPTNCVKGQGTEKAAKSEQMICGAIERQTISWDGVRLSPLGTSATDWSIVPASDDNGRLVEWKLGEETEILGGYLPQCHFIRHKSHMIWIGIEPGPSRWEASD
jgi:hypothetical protein